MSAQCSSERYKKALELEQPKTLKQNVNEYIDKLQIKVDETHNTLSRQLQNRKLADRNRYERDLHKIQNYEHILKKMEYEINEQPHIKQELNYIAILQEFSATLKVKFDELNMMLHNNYKHMDELQNQIQDLHIKMRDHNRINLLLQEKKKILLKRFKQKFYKLYNSSLTNSLSQSNYHQNQYQIQQYNLTSYKDAEQKYISISNQEAMHKQKQDNFMQQAYKTVSSNFGQICQEKNTDDYTNQLQIYKQEIDIQKKKNQEIINRIRKKSTQIIEHKAFLQNCFDLFIKKVVGEHKISNKKSGLAASLYLDISNQSTLYNNDQCSNILLSPAGGISCGGGICPENISKNGVKIPQKSRLQDREIRNTLFDTIKFCMIKKLLKDEKEGQGHKDPYQINQDRFLEFTPSQLISLLQIRPEYQKMMFFNVEMKEKAINLLLLKMNYLMKQNNVNQFNLMLENQERKAKKIIMQE